MSAKDLLEKWNEKVKYHESKYDELERLHDSLAKWRYARRKYLSWRMSRHKRLARYCILRQVQFAIEFVHRYTEESIKESYDERSIT